MLTAVFAALCLTGSAKVPITNFTIKEELFTHNKLHIVAQDSMGNTEPRVRGRYTFKVNGFEKILVFSGGIAEFPDILKTSVFLYIKLEGGGRPVPRLFFVMQSGAGTFPVKISLMWLVAIPLALVIVSFIFKRVIYLALILVVLFFIFNKGLDLSNYLTAIKDWIASHL